MDAHLCASLLSLLSHELRGPLGVMRGYLRLIDQQGEGLTAAHRQAVRGALQAGDRLADLLGQASTLAKLQRGELAFTFARQPLDPLVRAAVDAAVGSADVPFAVDLADTPPIVVEADRALLQTALAGIIAAVTRTQGGDARVAIAGRPEARGGEDGVALVVGGPDAEAAPPAPLDLNRGGLGLTLPFAAEIIAAHGGHVTERQSQGCEFAIVVWLPLAR